MISMDYMNFQRFALIFTDFGAWMFKLVSNDLLALKKLLLDSRLASCPLKTFMVFHRISCICIGFNESLSVFIHVHRFHRF